MKTKNFNRIIELITIIAILSIFLTACTDKKSEQAKEIYTCPMHPSVISDKPGACPVCGMALVKKTNQKNVSSDELTILQSVSLSPTQRVIANVATETVKQQTIKQTINAVGVVDFAEPNLATITARFSGRVEKLFVNYTGEIVKKGQELFELYSPDLISAQNELLLAAKNKQEMLLQVARIRLNTHFGLSEQQISEIEKSNKILYSIPFHSPISGTVISKEIQEGQYVDEGIILYRIADLSKVWVYLDVYEKDIPFVKVGSPVQLTSEAFGSEIFKGIIFFIDPIVNSETRTLRVRTEFSNPSGKLKPQMYVSAQIITQIKNALVVPSSAILYTGKRKVVWVEVKENTFEPRDVVTGIQSEDKVEIISGLNPGDVVVISGGYLLDSESQLQNPSSVTPHQHETSKKEVANTENNDTSNEVTIIVNGGYSPSTITAQKGKKLKIHFERHDDIKCTDEIVFPDFNIKKYLTPHKITTIEITPKNSGEYRFHCGMDMLEGKVLVNE